MVYLVAFLQAAQDRNGIFDRRLVNEDRLETPFQGRVFLDVLAVFIQGGRPDAVQLAAGQHRLEQIARIHGTFGFAGADDGMQFIDEQDDLALGSLDLFEDGLEALLELAAVLGTGDERAHVQGDDALILQPFRHVPADDALGKTFDNGRLADAGLTDQHGIVLGTPRQNLDDAANLLIAADDRIELALPGQLRQVAPIAFQGLISAFRVLRADALIAAHLLEGAHETIARDTELLQDPAGRPRILGHRQQEVLDGDVIVLELFGPVLSLGEQPIQTAADVRLFRTSRRTAHARLSLQLPVHAHLEGISRDV